MTTNSPQRSSLSLFSLIGGISCFALLLVISLSGCGTDDNDAVSNGGTKPPPQKDEIPIKSTIENLRPDVFGITVPRTLPRADLDAWGDSMLEDMIDTDVDEKVLAEQLASLLDPEQVERVFRRQFALRDCAHVRDMLWAHALYEEMLEELESASELERTTALFYHVVHTIALADSEQSLPLGPFESMLHGTGTSADRAWAFALLLQTRRMPVVVLEIPEVSLQDALITGVLIQGDVFLFDMARGLPVPAEDDKAEDGLILKPAALSQAVTDDSLLRKLDNEDSAYPVTAEKLQQAQLQIVGDTSLWSRRMEGLNVALSGAAPMYSPLVGENGMLQRVIDSLGGAVSVDRISVWRYPDRQRQARESLTDEQRSRLNDWDSPLQVPYLIRVSTDAKTKKPVVDAETGGRQTHRLARVDQILGRPEDAIPRYLKIQTWRDFPPTPRNHKVVKKTPEMIQLVNEALPEQVRADHAYAAEQAQFWRASSQFQRRNWTAAARDLEAYITACNRGQALQGHFRSQAAFLCGVAHARQKNWGYARSYMRLVPAESPAYTTARLLANRWDPLADL